MVKFWPHDPGRPIHRMVFNLIKTRVKLAQKLYFILENPGLKLTFIHQRTVILQQWPPGSSDIYSLGNSGIITTGSRR